MNKKNKKIGLLVLCVFIFSSILAVNNVKGFQTDDDLGLTLHGKLESNSYEVNETLMSLGDYNYWETPSLDIGDYSHDYSNFEIKSLRRLFEKELGSQENTLQAGDNLSVIANNSYTINNRIEEYTTSGGFTTNYDIQINSSIVDNKEDTFSDNLETKNWSSNISSNILTYNKDNYFSEEWRYVGWNVSDMIYDNINQTLQGSYTTNAFHFKPDGTKLYECDNTRVHQWNLSTPWDLNSISYYDWAEIGLAQDLYFKPDGTIVYSLSLGEGDIDLRSYSLSAPWDITTSTYIEKIGVQDGNSEGIYFSSDGTKFYELGSGNTLYQYNLSTSWEISTASLVFNETLQDTDSSGIYLKSNGTKLYESGNTGDKIYQHSLTTPWDIRSLSYDNLYVSTQDTHPSDVHFSSNGTKMFELGYDSHKVYQYTSNFYNISKFYQNQTEGYAYVQTDTTETLNLTSPVYSNTTYLRNTNTIAVELKTNNTNQINAEFYNNGNVVETKELVANGNADFSKRTVDLEFSEYLEFDQIKFTGEYDDTKYLKVYSIQKETDLEEKNIEAAYISDFEYQVLGHNYTETYELWKKAEAQDGLQTNYTYHFNSSYFTERSLNQDVIIPSQNLTLLLYLTQNETITLTTSVNYNYTNWKVPTEVDFEINSQEITDETYNSGYTSFDAFQESLEFTANEGTSFQFNSTSYFTFEFDLNVISNTYLKRSFELLSDHSIDLERIDFDEDLDIKRIYFNNDDLGSANSISVSKTMNTNNIYTIEVILAEEVYTELSYIKNDLGSGTANTLIRGLTNKINFQDISQYSDIRYTLPEGFEAYQSRLSFSDIQYKEFYESNSSEDISDYGYTTSDNSGNENVEWSSFEYYEEGKNGSKSSENSIGGYYNVDNETFNSENAEMSHSELMGYNNSYSVNSELSMSNQFPSEQKNEDFLNWNLNYDSDYTTSSHSNGDLESTLNSRTNTETITSDSSITETNGRIFKESNDYLDPSTTYDFDGETGDTSTSISMIDDDGSTGSMEVISSFDGHSEVLRFYETNGGSQIQAWDEFSSSQEYGTVEFFMGTSDINKRTEIRTTNVAWDRWTHIFYIDDGHWYDQNGQLPNVRDPTNNNLHHITMHFETTTGGYKGLGKHEYELIIDGITTGAIEQWESNSGDEDIYRWVFRSGDPDSHYHMYYDNFDYSWDSGYYEGRNRDYSFSDLSSIDSEYITFDTNDNGDINQEFDMSYDTPLTHETIEQIDLYYSHKTEISTAVSVYIYDYENTEWDLIEDVSNTASFDDDSYTLRSEHYNNGNAKVKYVSNDNEEYFLYLEKLLLNIKYTKSLGNVYADITKSVDFSFLNRYDSNADYQDLYNVSIEFDYTFTINNSDYSDLAAYYVNSQEFSLTKDGTSHSFSYNFIFNSSSLDTFSQKFNISNGLLELSNYEYDLIFECLDVNNLNNISQYFKLDPLLSLDYLQKNRGEFYLNFSIDFTQDTLFTYYSFHNSLNYSLFSYNISIKHEDGWNSSYFNTNSSITQNISFNISNFLSNLGKSQFLDYKIEFYVSGNNTQLIIDNIYLYDYDNEFYNVSNVYVSDYLLVYDQNITLSFKAIDRYCSYVEIYQTLTSKNLIFKQTLLNNTLQQKTFSNETVGFYELELKFYDDLGNYEIWALNYTIITLTNIKIAYQNPALIGDNATFSVQIRSKDAINHVHYDNSTNYILEYDNSSYPLYNYSFSFTVSYDIETNYNISIRVAGHSSGVFYCNITNLEFLKRSTKVSIHNLKSSYEQDDAFNISIDLRDLYNNPLENKVINYTLQAPNDSYVLNSSDTTDSDGEITITQNFTVSWDIGFYHLNISFVENDSAYLGVWELTSFEILPVSQIFTNCSDINLKVNNNNVSGTTITLNDTSSFTFEHLSNATFDLGLQFYLNYSDSISYSDYFDYSYTFEATSDITQLTIISVNLTSVPTNFTKYYVDDSLSSNYTLTNDNLQANELNNEILYNDNSFSIKLRYYEDVIERTQITSNPITTNDEVIFQETLLANRSFKYWYFENDLTINSISLEHIRTSTTISSFETDNSSNRYYFSQDCENQDLFTATTNYDPNWQISTEKITNNYGETRIKVSYKADLEVNNVSIVLNLKNSELFNGKATSNHLLTIDNVNFMTSTQVLYIDGNRAQHTDQPVEDLNSVEINETFYYDSEMLDSNIITLNPGYNISYKVLKNNGTYSKLEITRKSEFPLNNVDLSLDLSAYNLYNQNWTLGASQSETSFILYIPDVSFTTEFSSFTIEGESDVPYANITSYQSDNTWHHISVDVEVDMYAYLAYSKFSKVFKLNTSSSWDSYNVYYASDVYAAESISPSQIKISGKGFDPSINSSYLHFRTKPFSKATFDFTEDIVTIEITADYTIDNCYFLYQFDPIGIHDLIVWETGDIEISNVTDSEYKGYLYFETTQIKKGSHTIKIYVDFATPLEMFIQMVLPMGLSIAIIGVYYYLKNNEEVYEKLKEQLNERVIEKLQKARGDEGFEAATISIREDKIYISPAER